MWIEGEISDLRPAASGHVYFTLKDESAQLSVVLFRRQATLLRFRPEDGLHILLRGKLSVYEQRGQMQIVAEHLEPMGAGSLQLAFEQVKRQLQREGLFDSERKQPLPSFPRCVGIVTSPSGAVIRDFLNIVSSPPRRASGAGLSGTGAGRIGSGGSSRRHRLVQSHARSRHDRPRSRRRIARRSGALQQRIAGPSHRRLASAGRLRYRA